MEKFTIVAVFNAGALCVEKEWVIEAESAKAAYAEVKSQLTEDQLDALESMEIVEEFA